MTRKLHPRHPTLAGTIIVSVLAACSSSATASSSAGAPTLSSASSQTAAPAPASAAGSVAPCPSASVVGAALGQTDTGPVVSGTSQYEICTYRGGGPVATKITISVDTPTIFKASRQRVSANYTVATVPGLGDENYYLAGVGELFVLKADRQVEIFAPGTTDGQDQALARQLL